MALARSGSKNAATIYAIYAIERVAEIDYVKHVVNDSSKLTRSSLAQGAAFGDGEITVE